LAFVEVRDVQHGGRLLELLEDPARIILRDDETQVDDARLSESLHRADGKRAGGETERARRLAPRSSWPAREERDTSRVFALTMFLEPLERQRCVEERLYQLFEWNVHCAHSCSQAIGRDARRRVIPTRRTVTRMQHTQILRHELRVRSDEARMKTGVDERSTRTEHAGTFAYKSREIVNVSVREHRDHSGEVFVRERKSHRIRPNQLNSLSYTPTGQAELIGRDVDPRHFPAKCKQPSHVQAGPATEV
jgi:hypothetical protein